MTTIYLITGFLGAGKTTFLKERLLHAPVRTGVLVNDFGKVNFDGLQIKRQGMDLIELSNGSIFCSCLKDNFIEGLVELVERSLDEVYIESSGLADPSDMGKVLDSVRLRLACGDFTFGGAICLVDALFFPRVLPKMLSVERQLRHSHLVLVNKCDLVGAAELAAIEQTILSLNPKVKILRTTYGQVDWDNLQLEVFAIPDEETTNRIETRNKNLSSIWCMSHRRMPSEPSSRRSAAIFSGSRGSSAWAANCRRWTRSIARSRSGPTSRLMATWRRLLCRRWAAWFA